MKKYLFTIILAVFLALTTFHLSIKDALAVCGTYIISEDRCVDAGSGDEIGDFSVCEGEITGVGFGTCCSTVDECPNPPPVDDDPPYPESNQNCGRWAGDPVYGNLCFGNDGDNSVISNPVQCPFPTECCRDESQCTLYYGCVYDENSTPTGRCEVRYTGGNLSTDHYYCVRGCQPPDISDTPPMLCNGGNGVNSAIGCIPINDTWLMLEFWFRWGIGLAGGFSFLLIIYSAFMMMTSTGDPKRIQAGQELLTSAIAGVIFLVFSVFILRLVGVDILHIPGWGV